MLLFLIGILILVGGYFTYGRFVERVVGPDDRLTPAHRKDDGVDYVRLPHWKNLLIQLLNIAGTGPVIGVILGIKFGAIVFLIIPIGNLLGGATHDYLCGMMSLRNDGANLPKIITKYLGACFGSLFSVLVLVKLLMSLTVFINVPADLCDKTFMTETPKFWIFVVLFFIYYILSATLSIDKIIGKLYPVFGTMLLVGTMAILVALLFAGCKDPSLFTESAAFKDLMFHENDVPLLPMLFVTITCGIISGFHATQSPIVARTLSSERQARSTFYGMMVVEGVIAMIWAGAAMAIYNLKPELMEGSSKTALLEITRYFLGNYIGVLTVFAVIILAITSGDTTLRCLRLCIAEIFKINQVPIRNRIFCILPVVAAVCCMLYITNHEINGFQFVWNYSSCGNQAIAASTLMAAAVWLYQQKKNYWIAVIPGAFMTFIVATFIFWSGTAHKQACGLGMNIDTARWLAIGITLLFLVFVAFRARKAIRNSEC